MDAFDIIQRIVHECPKEKIRKEESTSQNYPCQQNDMFNQKLLDPYNLDNYQDAQPNDYIYEQENILENKEINSLFQLPEQFNFQETKIILANLSKQNYFAQGFSELKQILEEDIESYKQDGFMEVYDQIIKPDIATLTSTLKKSKKNSNAIKKIGRIILNNIDCFQRNLEKNQGIDQMIALLNKRAKDKQRPKDIRDGFNTSHLEALFSNCSEVVTTNNLMVAKRLFSKKLRSQIFSSAQIQVENNLLYLNTLKCSALRFCNKKLAVRLQVSENR